MPSRRRRLTMLRVLGTTPHTSEILDGNGMDAPLEPQNAGCDAARSRSAPVFCQPQPVPPKPFRPTKPQPVSASVHRPEIVAEAKEHPRTIESSPTDRFSVPSPRLWAPASRIRHDEPVQALWGSEPTIDEGDSEEPIERPAAGSWVALARGVALMLGTLLAIDLFATGGLAANGPWWLDTRPLPVSVAAGLLGTSTAALFAFAIRGSLPPVLRGIAMLCLGLLIAVALKNATVYYGLLKRGDLHAGPPIAFPLHVAACLGVVVLAMRSAPGPAGLRGTLFVLAGFNAAMMSFPVAQIACSGPIDGRRSAATALVFATRRSEADSEARLEARVRAAAELYAVRLTPGLILTGSESEEPLEKMRRLAIDNGVPESAIEITPLARESALIQQVSRRYEVEDGRNPVVMMVSEYDHLPRLAIEGRRAGITVAQVPSPSGLKPSRETLLRETLALWRCYFRR